MVTPGNGSVEDEVRRLVLNATATVALRTGVTTNLLTSSLEIIWTLMCAFMMALNQLGFAMWEVGSCRAAHRMTVLAKNVLNVCMAGVAYYTYCLVWKPWLIRDADGEDRNFLRVYYWVFCATTVTICSGAMAERTQMLPCLCHAALIGGVVFPEITSSVWAANGILRANFDGEMFRGHRFHDISGGGLVHFAGGVSALLGISLLGRRVMRPLSLGSEWSTSEALQEVSLRRSQGIWPRRFDDSVRDDEEFRQCSYLQALGALALWVGWYGYNAGAIPMVSADGKYAVGNMSWNTTLAAGSGSMGAFLYVWFTGKGLDVGIICNGMLAGLVTITGGYDVVKPWVAVVACLAAGAIIFPASSRLMQRFRLDDPVDAVAVHGVCGFYGVLVAGLCVPDCPLGGHLSPSPVSVEYCDPGHSVWWQLLAQVWGLFTILWCHLSVALLIWGLFAVSECIQHMEAPALLEATRIVREAANTNSMPSLDSEGVMSSYIVRQILRRHGLEEHPEDMALLDIPALQVDLQEAATMTASALELSPRGPTMRLAALLRCCQLTRWAARLRLRILPDAELSGLGANEAAGGWLLTAVTRALAFALGTEQADQRNAMKEQLEAEVRELARRVKLQRARLKKLTRSRNRSRGATPPRNKSPSPQNSVNGADALSPTALNDVAALLVRAMQELQGGPQPFRGATPADSLTHSPMDRYPRGGLQLAEMQHQQLRESPSSGSSPRGRGLGFGQAA